MTEPPQDMLPSEIEDLDRLRRLKAERDALDLEIKYLTEWTRKAVHGSAVWEADNVTWIVTVSSPPISESIDLDKLNEVNPELVPYLTEQVTVLVEDKVKQAKALGFFAEGKPAHAALVRKEGTPRVSINAQKETKETTSE